MVRPVSASSRVARSPMTRRSAGSTTIGNSPMRTSVVPKVASSAAIARSQSATSPQPPTRA
jgi:hypothetical protein